jgi:predicted dehydrogenase
MNAGIVGCGLMGAKRAAALGPHRLAAVCDALRPRAEALAERHPGCAVSEDWRSLASRPDLDCVLVCSPHDLLAPVSLAALEAGKHVLVEKPGGRNAAEVKAVLDAARRSGKRARVGFNHRFHPALLKAREIASAGELGDLMFLRARYGHGGRLGYENEWRASPAVSGGGELLDQGVHLIDLSRCFLGDFEKAEGFLPTYFWEMPVEDNAFLLLRTARGQAAWLHASWTEWKNTFSMEIYGRKGKLLVEGLGGSYGPERLVHYRMAPDMKPPAIESFDFPGPDDSWRLEFSDFARCAAGEPGSGAGVEDALAVLEIVDSVYGRKA